MTESEMADRILLVVDASNFEYVCIFSAVSKWEKKYADEAAQILSEHPSQADQDNLPELLNVSSFRKVLNFVVQDKLEQIRVIVRKYHQAELDSANGMDVVFALDGDLSKNFRKKLYPEYKAQREKMKQRFSIRHLKPYIQDVIFKELNIENAFGYKMISVDGCESDDIIATIMTNYNGYMARILISSDKDFLQLKDVYQYNCWGEKVERTIKDVVEEPVGRSEFLLWKIIRGDLSDNIKNVFPKYGDKKSWLLVQDRDKLKKMLSENNDATERFKLNSTLIDFRRIPKDYTDRILVEVEKKLNETPPLSEFNLDECIVI